MPPNPAPRITIRGFMAVGYCHRVAVGRNAPARYLRGRSDAPCIPTCPPRGAWRARPARIQEPPRRRARAAHRRAIGYARRVEEALRPTLTGLDLPLILAASEPLDSIFRSVSTYAHLARPVIPGDGPAAAILRYPV